MYHRMFLGHSDSIYTCICITECFWDTLIQYIHVYVSQNVFGKLWYNIHMYMYHRMLLGHLIQYIHVYVSQNVFGKLWYNIYMYMHHRMFLGHSDTIYTCLCITECFWDTLIQFIYMYMYHRMFWDTLIQYLYVCVSQNVFWTL